MTRIEVAVGIVYNKYGQVLVGQRVIKDQYFEKWEFPGGKIELGETPIQALNREFLEETALDLLDSKALMLIEHDYPDRQVRLHVHTASSFNGTVEGLEGQALKWVDIADLDELDFLAGNQVILDEIKSLS